MNEIRRGVLAVLSVRPATARDLANVLGLESMVHLRLVCKALRRERMVQYHGPGAYGDKAMRLTSIGRARLAAGME